MQYFKDYLNNIHNLVAVVAQRASGIIYVRTSVEIWRVGRRTPNLLVHHGSEFVQHLLLDSFVLLFGSALSASAVLTGITRELCREKAFLPS